MGKKFYAVSKGLQTGIFRSWTEVEPLVKGYPGAKYKSFKSLDNARAFLDNSTYSETYEPSVEVVSSTYFSTEIGTRINNNSWDNLSGISAFTDGSCVSEYGGYGGIIVIDNIVTDVLEGPLPDYPTTNNRSELYAIRQVLVKYTGDITIYTDSQYSRNALTKWVLTWISNGWLTSTRKPVKNKHLILEIIELCQGRNVVIEYVPAHKGIEYNEMADRSANKGRQNYS